MSRAIHKLHSTKTDEAHSGYGFQTLFNHGLDAILIADDQGTYVDANPAACEIFGLERDQLIGKRVFDFVDPARITPTAEAWDDFTQQRVQKGEFHLTRLDGQIRILEYSAILNFEPGRHLSILRDITKQKKALEDLQKSEAEAQRAYAETSVALSKLQLERELRDRFVQSLTHDLRNPLLAARMFAQLVIRAGKPDELATKNTERVIRNLDRVDSMIQTLLDASRISAGQRLTLLLEACELQPLLTELIAELSTVHEQEFILEIDPSPRSYEGYWDGKNLLRAIENLCTNAIKYGTPGRPITIRVRDRGERIEISIHNEGSTIAPEERAKLFEPFHRAQAAQDSRIKGWGIGLVIVKGIVEAHGGSILIDSTQETGTTFTLSLPRDPQTQRH